MARTNKRNGEAFDVTKHTPIEHTKLKGKQRKGGGTQEEHLFLLLFLRSDQRRSEAKTICDHVIQGRQ